MRISEAVSVFGGLSISLKNILDSLEQIIIQTKQIQSTFSDLRNVITAADYNSELDNLTKENFDQLNKVATKLNKLFFQFNTYVFSVSDIELSNSKDVLAKISDLTSKNIYETNWVHQELDKVNAELNRVNSATKDSKWRNKLSVLYQQFKACHSLINQQSKSINQKKATDPVFSNDAVAIASKLKVQISKGHVLLQSLINQVYQSECKNHELHESIACYLIISGKLN